MEKNIYITQGSDIFVEVSFMGGGIPLYDFDVEIYGCLGNKVVASKRGDVFTNCVPKGNVLRIAIDQPTLGRGVLKGRTKMYVPDDRFPDGFRKIVNVEELATIR